MKPLLSIVIPTKDRYDYLVPLLELIKSFDSYLIEIVVQDNSKDNSGFLAYLKSFNYPCIKYDYCANQIPISDNSDKAILNSSGEYVCFVGDDDGVTRHIIDYTQWMKDNNVDVLGCPEISYNWPDYAGPLSAAVIYKKFTGKVLYLDPIQELIEICKKGLINRGRLPMVYHGIAKRETLDKVYEKCGTFFPGQSPDIANGVSLAFMTNKYAYVDLPITIAGASKYHGGGQDKQQYLDINKRPWMRQKASDLWDKRIPMFGVGSLVWAESALNAIKIFDKSFVSDINFTRVVSFFMLYNSDLISSLPRDFISTRVKIDYVLLKILRPINAVIRRIKWLLFPDMKTYFKKGINNINEAAVFLYDISKKNE